MFSFRIAHSRTLFIFKNFVSSFVSSVSKRKFFYGSSFTMSGSTAKIARKKATTLPTILDDASLSDVILEQVFGKVSHKLMLVDGKPLMTAKSILGIDFDSALKVDQIRKFFHVEVKEV
jgi:hypothetical protein